MKVQLYVTSGCTHSARSRLVWEAACGESGDELEIVEFEDSRDALGRPPADHDPSLTVLPAVKIEGRLVAVGVQRPDQARALLEALARQG